VYGSVDHHIPPASFFCWEASFSCLCPRQHPAPNNCYWFLWTILGSFYLDPAYPSNQVHPPIAPIAVVQNNPEHRVPPVGPTGIVLCLHEESPIDIAVGVGEYGTTKPHPCVTDVVVVRRKGQAIDEQASAGLAVGIADSTPWIKLLDNTTRQYFECILSKQTADVCLVFWGSNMINKGKYGVWEIWHPFQYMTEVHNEKYTANVTSVKCQMNVGRTIGIVAAAVGAKCEKIPHCPGHDVPKKGR
jgi:hypothetical protein